MITLLEKIKTERITAMKLGESFRKETIAAILAAVKQVEVDTRKELNDVEVTQILTKMIKQRQESITQFNAGGRPELAQIEEHEKIIIQEFLPQQLTETEVAQMIAVAIKDTEASGIKDMGKVISVLRPQLTGRFDMGKVSASVKILLGG